MEELQKVEAIDRDINSLDGFTWRNGSFMAISGSMQSIIRGDDLHEKGILPRRDIKHSIKNPGGIAGSDSKLLIVEKKEKVVYEYDQTVNENERFRLNFDPKNKNDRAMAMLNAKASTLHSIACSKGKIWLTCQAGYSSSVLCYDVDSKELIDRFFAKGPTPHGISFEKDMQFGWVLDSSNKQLCQFEESKRWTGTKVGLSELKSPSGLAIDDKNEFWVADAGTNTLNHLTRRK